MKGSMLIKNWGIVNCDETPVLPAASFKWDRSDALTWSGCCGMNPGEDRLIFLQLYSSLETWSRESLSIYLTEQDFIFHWPHFLQGCTPTEEAAGATVTDMKGLTFRKVLPPAHFADQFKELRFEVHTVATMNIAVSGDVTSCILVEFFQGLEDFAVSILRHKSYAASNKTNFLFAEITSRVHRW